MRNIQIPKDQLSTMVMVEGCNLYPCFSHIGQLLFDQLDHGIALLLLSLKPHDCYS
jgi:hypothetical protein